ncbi:hypothetical protein Trydic_g942 [Trypoxylus dichotomus]
MTYVNHRISFVFGKITSNNRNHGASHIAVIISSIFGLIYEEIGNASIYIKDFNMLTFYDLEKYYSNYNELIKLITSLQKYCERNDYDNCNYFKVTANRTLATLNQKHDLIQNIVGISTAPVRRKRFFSFLGSVISGIFGIVKGRQEQRAASREISKYREEVGHLRNMVAHQMYLYQNLQYNVNQRFSKISTDINDIYKQLGDVGRKLIQQHEVNRLVKAVQHISNLIQLLSSEQADLLDCLILARQGVLHPMIISPVMLKKKLLEVRNLVHYNKEMVGILENSANDANSLFNMIKPVIYVENQTIVFDLSIPLIAESLYTVYKLTSAPVPVSENVYAYVYPENPYMFVDKKYERHFFLNKQEFDECKLVNEKEYLCKRLKPLRNRKLTCEHMLISDDESMPENCDIRMIKIDRTLFIELERERSWIFIAPRKERLSLFCDQLIHNIDIEGTGIVNVDSGCGTTQTDDIILRDFSTNNLNLSQNYEVLIPGGNLKKYVENLDLTHLSATMNLMLGIIVYLYFSFGKMKNASGEENLPKPLMLLAKEQGNRGNPSPAGNIYQ